MTKEENQLRDIIMRTCSDILPLILLLSSCGPNKVPKEELNPGDQGTEGWSPVFLEPPAQDECSEAKINSLFEESDNDNIIVNCNITLSPDDYVEKRLVFPGHLSSGVTLNCNGATISYTSGDTIAIRSQLLDDEWIPAHDITVRNCNVDGSIRIWGLGINGESENLTESSHTLDHVSNTRNAAPYNITIENSSIVGNGRIPLYLSPGAHNCSIINSSISGQSNSVMVYLDAESNGNILDNNAIRSSEADRETIAVDGSSNNVITNNYISGVSYGGIYLYRNCGQGGNVRHTTPSYNTISNNNISCVDNILDIYAAVFLGSRDGHRGYCDEDYGYPFGSSISDYDYARFNSGSGNSFRRCDVKSGNNSNYSNNIE